MRVIDVSKPGKVQRITALSYGLSRSGKTRFAGSWPRPLFLADATESGWTTLSNMDKSLLFEPQVSPIVWAIETATDMMQAVANAEPLVKAGTVQTVVIDSVTFYSDLFFNALDASGRADQRQLYQKLGQHLKTLRERIHLLGCNVVWLALEKSPGDDNAIGGPMLSGQQAAKFSAGCDYLLYHRSFQTSPSSPLQWEVRTKRYQNYQAGGRDEGRLPDPLGYVTASAEDPDKDVFVPDCTYRTLAEALDILPNNSALPAIATGTTAKPIATGTTAAPAAASKSATNNKTQPRP